MVALLLLVSSCRTPHCTVAHCSSACLCISVVLSTLGTKMFLGDAHSFQPPTPVPPLVLPPPSKPDHHKSALKCPTTAKPSAGFCYLWTMSLISFTELSNLLKSCVAAGPAVAVAGQIWSSRRLFSSLLMASRKANLFLICWMEST